MLCILAAYSQDYKISYTYEKETINVEITLNSYSIGEILTSDGTFSRIKIGSTTPFENKGWAELPFASTTINLNEEDANIEITSTDFHEIHLDHPLIPSRGTIYRNQKQDSIPYFISSEANNNEFYPKEITIFETFQFRNEKKCNIRIFPFQYNHTQQTLRIYDKISLKIDTRNTKRDITPLQNYDYGDILVITPEKYDSAIQPFIRWKREMGYNVSVEICDSAENVTTKIREAYSHNPNLLFVQLIGDWNDVQSEVMEDGSSPADPAMGCVAGSDNYPDIAISRISCSNEEELSLQLQKCILYEKMPNNNRDWREKFIGIGSGEGPGDDEELDYEHVEKIYNNRLANFTYDVHSEHYNNGTNVSSNALATSINVGASSIAYCGHGSGSYWLTGSYGGSSVTSASNGDKLPFVVSVACLNGAFHESEDCFAEKWMKAPHGGAVATLMSSISQPWRPPMRGQDYFYDILCGGYDYDTDSTSNGLNNNEQRTHWGSVVLNAFYLMLCESAQASDIETVKSWISFGDASLQLRTTTPEKITSSKNIITTGENYITTITSNGNAVKNALVCISQNGNYYKGFTNSRGRISLGHNLEKGKALLVVTAFNKTTIYDSIPVISSEEPYVVVDSYSPESINFGESTKISLNLQNCGNITADSVSIKISCEDEFLSILNDSIFIERIQDHETIETQDLEIASANETPYGHIFHITTQIEYNDSIFDSELEIALKGQDCYPPDEIYVEYTNDTCRVSWSETTNKNYTIFDDFDNTDEHPSFEINSTGNAGWQFADGDVAQTIGITGYTFANNREKMAFIVMNPSKTYSDTCYFDNLIRPHSGNQFLASFRSTIDTTNDWLISPELNFNGDFELSFYVRGSHKPSYWETMEVYYSSDYYTERIDSCTIKGSSNPDNWTFKSYTIPDSAKHIAIRNISYNRYFLCLDDIKISGNKTYSTNEVDILDNGSIIASNISDGTFLISNISEGEHCYGIQSACNQLVGADTTICISVVYECDAPANVECYRYSGRDSLIWSASPNASSYNIYCDGALIANATDTSYICNIFGETYSISSICRHNESEQVVANTTILNNLPNISHRISVYPNPTNGLIHIDTAFGTGTMIYTITDICGKQVSAGNLHAGENTIDIHELPDGMYVISTISGTAMHKTKIIKQEGK